MKKTVLYISNLLALLFMFSACSSEETIIPGEVPFVDPFIIPADKTDAESVLRRGFYERTGVHLVLRDEVGQTLDANGNPYTEMIDLQWGFTTQLSPDNYDILEPEQQANAVAALEKYIISHIHGEGNSLFSVYPVADYYDSSGDTQYIYNNVRCTLINMKQLLGAENEEDIISGSKAILKKIAEAMLDNLSYDEKEAFYDFSEEYHYEYIVDYIDEWWDEQDMSYIYEYGFVNYNKDRYGDIDYDYFPSYLQDFYQYRDFVLDYSEEYVRENFADYPLVIAKYELMKSLLIKAGYVL